MKKKFLTFFFIACMGVSACTSMVDIEDKTSDGYVLDLQPTMSLSVKDTQQLVLGLTYDASMGGNPEISWLSSDTSIATVNNSKTETVLVTGVSSGTCFVTAFVGKSSSASCRVTVGSGGSGQTTVTSITLSETSKEFVYDPSKTDVENSFTLTATVITNNSATVNPSWTSTVPEVATVSGSGATATVQVRKAGITTIKASAGGLSASCSLNVTDNSEPEQITVGLDKASAALTVGNSTSLTAIVKGGTPVEIKWESNDPSVTVEDNNNLTTKITGVEKGNATVSVVVTDAEGKKDSATCTVVVREQGGSSAYDQFMANHSQGGHIYFHYLRKNHDYDNWAIWAWQTKPKSREGSLWGANHAFDTTLAKVDVKPQTYGFMTNNQFDITGSDVYKDEHGIIIDVDITNDDLPGGKTGKKSPLVTWSSFTVKEQVLGFFIVDQAHMTGETNWESDGGGEIYIEDLYSLMPNGKESFLHIYCVQGNVANYTTSSGESEEEEEYVNPTIDDIKGEYRSTDNKALLTKDDYPNGIPTSETFVEDKPGVGYQIFVPSFADSDGDGMGDIGGIINKLDYLQNDVGAKVLWLTPIQKSNSYHGYDVTDYYRIDSKYGTLEQYQRLIYECHKRDMKVLMDMVINHTSKSNVLFQKSEQARVETINGKEINYRDMYIWKYKGDPVRIWNGYVTWKKPDGTIFTDNVDHTIDGYSKVDNQSGNFTTATLGGTSDIDKKLNELWYKDGESNYYYFGKFGSGMAELNYNSQATRDFMTDMCKYWLSFGLDGFRLDATKHIYLLGELSTDLNLDPNDIVYDVGYKYYWNEDRQTYLYVDNDYSYHKKMNVTFWKQFAGSIKSAYPNCFLVGENFDGWDARMAPFYESMDSQFDFQTYFKLSQFYPSSFGNELKNTIDIYKSYRRNGMINGAFTSNHDIYRMLNHAANHDVDVTKGVNGDNHVEVNDTNKQTAINWGKYYGFATIMTPGVSWIYYGDELGMSGNLKDEVKDSGGTIYNDHGNNVDRWYRQPMRWGTKKGHDQVVDYVFGGIEILWDNYNQKLPTVDEQKSDPNSMLNMFKAACKIKNDKDHFPTYGNVTSCGGLGNADYTKTMAMEISDGARTVVACFNNTDQDVSYSKLGWSLLGGFGSGYSATNVPAHGFIVLYKGSL